MCLTILVVFQLQHRKIQKALDFVVQKRQALVASNAFKKNTFNIQDKEEIALVNSLTNEGGDVDEDVIISNEMARFVSKVIEASPKPSPTLAGHNKKKEFLIRKKSFLF